MDRAAIEDLFAYTDFAWREITNTIADAGDDVLARPAPGSGWPALRNCLGHMILAYERWVAGLPERKSLPMTGFDPEAIQTLAQLEEHRSKARRQFRSFLDSLSDEELHLMQDFDIDGDTIRYSYAELLTHLLLHERGHQGDVTTLFYQLGVEIPMLEYRFHLGRTGYDD